MTNEVSKQAFSSEPGIATKRFFVGFSFAGETRDFVSEVANLLAAKIGNTVSPASFVAAKNEVVSCFARSFALWPNRATSP